MSVSDQKQNPLLPKHIAIIMDGNGRWAKQRGLPRTAGHKAGAETFRKIATYCKDIGVQYLTVYAFSTENWKRPQSEVSALMTLFSRYIDTALSRFSEKQVRVVFLGDKSVFSKKIVAKMEKLERLTENHTDTLNIAFNYGGRDEIVHACNEALKNGEAITEETIARHLYTVASPDPDLIVRTAGEMRLSNFLLWQAAYAEFYYTETLWPDMTPADVDAAVAEFYTRQRRFGGL